MHEGISHEAIVSIATKVAGAGVVTTFATWGMDWNVFIGLGGLLVAVTGVVISAVYRHKTYKLLLDQTKKNISNF